MMTAGHCVVHGGGSGRTWNHHSIAFGTSRVSQFCDRCSADVGIIEVNSWATPTNVVYAGGTGDIRSITSWAHNSAQGLGVGACRAGGKSNNYLCGRIVTVDGTITFVDHFPDPDVNVIYNHVWEIDVASQQGDSGGSVMYNNTAKGIAVAGSTRTAYSTLDWILSSVGYNVCITSNTNPCK
jgi:hypothetical protein